jgi:hypothetical protein
MIVTNRAEWASYARYLTTQAKDDPLEYIHHQIGYNYRLTNLQAALGCAQMEKLEEFIRRKRIIAANYHAHLADLAGIRLPAESTMGAGVLIGSIQFSYLTAEPMVPVAKFFTRLENGVFNVVPCGNRFTAAQRTHNCHPECVRSQIAYTLKPLVCRVQSASPANSRI